MTPIKYTPKYIKASNIFYNYQHMINSLHKANSVFEKEEVAEQFGFVTDAIILNICRLMKWDSEKNDIFGIICQWMISIDDGDFETMRLIVEEVNNG